MKCPLCRSQYPTQNLLSSAASPHLMPYGGRTEGPDLPWRLPWHRCPPRQRWLSAGRAGHGRTSGRCRCGSFGDEWPATPPPPPPPSACKWPTAVRRAAISPFFSSKLPMSSSVRPSKAALEQNPSSPRALATALGSPHSDKNAPKSKRLAMLAVRCCNFAGAAQSARFSPCLSLYPFSPPPHLNNRPLIGPPIPYSPLHLSLPSLHPASCPLDTPAPQCSHAPLPRLPPSPLAVVTWCLNSSSLNSATSTKHYNC